MAGNQELAFAIRAVNEASAVLKKVQGDVDDLGGSSGKTHGLLSGMGGALGNVASIASGFVLGTGLLQAPGMLLDFAKGAGEDEQASMRMDLALSNLNDTLGGSTAQLDDWRAATDDAIAAGQRKAFGDDDVRDSLQKLIASTGDYEEATKRQALAMDLARGANIPLAQASTLLGKVTDENVNVFKRMGITMKEGATEADVLATVQGKFGGQADAYAKSTAGQFEVAKIRMDEAKETIGYAVLPMLTKLATFASDVVLPAIEQMSAQAGPLFAAIGTFLQERVLPQVLAFADYFRTNIQPRILEFAEYVRVKFAEFQVYYDESIKPALANIQRAVQAVIGFVVDHWPEISAVVLPVLRQVQNAVQFAFTLITGVLDVIIKLIGGDFSGAWVALQHLVEVVWDYIVSSAKNALDLLRGLGQIAYEAAMSLGGMIKDGLIAGIRGAVGAIGSIGEQLLAGLKWIINSAIDAINYAIPDEIGLNIMGSFIGFELPASPIPHLANGGIVRARPGGTLVLAGEGGQDEAVVPLGGRGALGGHTFNIYALDGRSARDAVARLLVELEDTGRLAAGTTVR